MNITLEKTDTMGRYDHRKRVMKKIAVMTGGGDCPGLNAAIRAVVITGLQYQRETLGIRNGWKGLIDGDLLPLNDSSVSAHYFLGWNHSWYITDRSDERLR